MADQNPTLTVHRIDPKTNLYLFDEVLVPDAEGKIHVPGNCVQAAMPAGHESKWQQWVSDVPLTNYRFGLPETGFWQLIDDYRKTDLYLTADGTKYALESEQDIDEGKKSYPGYGDLPAWLTTTERPSRFHSWIGAAWVLDQEAFDTNAEANERAWRDGEISRITWLRDRHTDELAQGLATTTLNGDQYTELLAYVQQLRDWPAQPEFPQVTGRPEKPGWL